MAIAEPLSLLRHYVLPPCLPSYFVRCFHIYIPMILIPQWYVAPMLHSQCTVNAQSMHSIAQSLHSHCIFSAQLLD